MEGKFIYLDDIGRNVLEELLKVKAGSKSLPERVERLSSADKKVQAIVEVSVDGQQWLRSMVSWQPLKGISGDDAILLVADHIRKRRASEQDTEGSSK